MDVGGGMDQPSHQPHSFSWWGLIRILTGATIVGGTLELLGVPAGMLLGGVVGAVLANQPYTSTLAPARFPRPLRQIGLIGVGLVSGLLLTAESLVETAVVAGPVVLVYSALAALNLIFISILMVRYDIDPATAVLAVTPGGLAEVSSMAIDKGAQLGVVLTIHSVRLFALVLLILPVLLAVLSR